MSTALAQVEYLARPGSCLSHKAAAIVGPEIHRLAKDGSLTAARLVFEAEPEEAPLHPFFEWDNARAGELHRQHQARQMITAVVIKEAGPDGQPDRILPAFVHVRMNSEQKEAAGLGDTPQSPYLPVAQVMSEDERVREKMAEAARQLRTWRANFDLWRAVSGEFADRFQTVFEFVDGLGAAPDGEHSAAERSDARQGIA